MPIYFQELHKLWITDMLAFPSILLLSALNVTPFSSKNFEQSSLLLNASCCWMKIKETMGRYLQGQAGQGADHIMVRRKSSRAANTIMKKRNKQNMNTLKAAIKTNNWKIWHHQKARKCFQVLGMKSVHRKQVIFWTQIWNLRKGFAIFLCKIVHDK